MNTVSDSHPAEPAPAGEKLPFEPFTLLKALWQKRWWLVLIVVIAAGAGLGAALAFGTRIYHAQTIMLFKPGTAGTPEEQEAAIKTLLNLVKIEANLREVRKRLNLAATLPDLAKAIEIYEQGDTHMVVFRAQWTDADTPAKLANTLRDVFFEFLEARKKKKEARPDEQQAEIAEKLREARTELKEADDKLDRFITDNQVVDLEKQVQWTLEEKTNLEFVFQNATVEKRTLDLQMSNLDKIIKDLGDKANQEAASASASEDLGDLNIRFRRLRDAIHDDRWNRAQAATLAHLESVYQSTKKLYDKGMVPKAELVKAQTELERQKALSVDTPQIEKWKDDIKELDKVVIPKKGGSAGPSAKLLHQMMMRYFEVQLSHVAIEAKVEYLRGALDRVQEKLNNLTKLQRRLVTLKREVSSAEAEKKRLEDLLAQLKTKQQPAASQLELLSTAQPPIRRTESNRKLIAIGLTGFLSMAGFGLILLMALLNPRIRSSAELIHKLEVPVLSQVPNLPPEQAGLPDCENPATMEHMRIAASRLRKKMPASGVKILLASTLNQEGKTFAAAQMASYLGRRDERVLLIETREADESGLLPEQTGLDLSDLLLDGEKTEGLSEYLNLIAATSREILHPTCMPGVDLLPMGQEDIPAELLASKRMAELMEELSSIYSVIIWDAPPALTGESAITAAGLVDGIVLVVAAETAKTGQLKRAKARLSEKGAPILGAIMNRVRPPFDEVRGL